MNKAEFKVIKGIRQIYGGEWVINHPCSAFGTTIMYTIIMTHFDIKNKRCLHCKKKIPKGVLGQYWLMQLK